MIPLAPSVEGAPPPVPALEVDDLVKHFPVRADWLGRPTATLRAVDGVSLRVMPGETVGLVGESGCGKSTVARLIMQLLEPTSGAIAIDGQVTRNLRGGPLRQLRRDVQMVFQDPYASLNPRMTVFDIVAEPLRNYGVASGKELVERVAELLASVGLGRHHMDRLPGAFSGGQRQRICIARAIALNPKLVICDEPVSALDVSVQAQVVNLLMDLQKSRGMSYLFVSHDLKVVRHISHRVAVMYLGRIVEFADKRTLYRRPAHPYTDALLDAVPRLHPGATAGRRLLEGDVPSPIAPPAGCAFRSRCRMAAERCATETPLLRQVGTGHFAACHRAEDMLLKDARDA
ncbi:ABC transporter ATP-binding protein [Segnochrobactraceae bacterium EtOH-i3]